MQVTIQEGLEKIIKNVTKVRTHIVPLECAIGEISAKKIVATISLPRFNNSAMDGYGLKGKSKSYKIVGKILAGDDSDIELEDGQCVRITTGAKTPHSCECVIPQENTRLTDDTIELLEEIKTGANIRFEGEDILEGKLVLDDGDVISSNFISLLASQGITHVQVYKKPRIAIFASGSELKMAYEKLGNAQIYNSNTPYLNARAKELGCEVTFVGKSIDSVEALQELVKNSLEYDLIVSSGGVSVGEADFTKAAFAHFEMQTLFNKVKVKPGKPTTFGLIGKSAVLNLPGNPLAASLNFEIFGKLIINVLSGKKAIHQNYIESKISEDFKVNKPVDTIVPGIYDGKVFTPSTNFGPNMVNVLNHCNGYIIISAKTSMIIKDSIVKFIPINWSFSSSESCDFLT